MADLRVLFSPNPPEIFSDCKKFPTLEPSIDCLFPGYVAEILSLCAAYAKMHIVPIVIDGEIGGDIETGTLHNRNWSDVLGMISTGQVDTACHLSRYSDERAKNFSYSTYVAGTKNIYITKPGRKSLSMSLWNAFFPYEPSVWILLLVALLMQSSVATLVAKIEFGIGLRAVFNPIEKFWQYLRLHVHQITEFQTPFVLQSGNLSFILYAVVQATLFTNLYTAVILSALVQGQNPKPWNSFREMVGLIKSQEYSLVMERREYQKGFLSRTLKEHLSSSRNLRDALNKNPVVLVEAVVEALDMVEKGNYIYAARGHQPAFQQGTVGLQLATERCNLFFFEDEKILASRHFLFPKNSSLLHAWNRAIRDNRPFIEKTFEKYFDKGYHPGKIPSCPDSVYDIREAARPLDFVSTFGIFMIAFIGFALSILVFLLEIYVDSKAITLRLRTRMRRAMTSAFQILTSPLRIISELRKPNQGKELASKAGSRQASKEDGELEGKDTSASRMPDAAAVTSSSIPAVVVRKRISALRFYDVGDEGRTMF